MSGFAWAAALNGLTGGIDTGMRLRGAYDARKEKEAMKSDLAAANQGIEVKQSDNLTFGGMPADSENGPSQTMPEAPVVKSTFKAGSKTFDDQAGAQKYSDTYNSPAATAARVGSAIGKYDPVKGMEYTAKAKGLEADDARLKGLSLDNEAKTQSNKSNALAEADKAWAREFNGVDSWEKMAGFMSKTGAIGDDMKFAPVPTADGKKIGMGVLLPNGEVKAPPPETMFDNTPEGFLKFKAFGNKLATPEVKLKFLQEEKEMQRKAGSDALDSKYKTALIENMGRDNGRADRMTTAQIENMYAGQRNADGRLTLERDKLNQDIENGKTTNGNGLIEKNISSSLQQINAALTKSKADGTYDPESIGIKELLRERATLTLQLRQMSGAQNKIQADPALLRAGKPNATERQMKVNASGDMGSSAAQYQEEIKFATQQLKNVKDPESRKLIEDHIAFTKQTMQKYFPSATVADTAAQRGVAAIPR